MNFQINELHAMILPVMEDGRERTASDVFNRLKKVSGFSYGEGAVVQALAALRDNGYLKSVELSRLVVYRMRKGKKVEAPVVRELPRKVGRRKLEWQGFARPVGQDRWTEDKLRDRWRRLLKN